MQRFCGTGFRAFIAEDALCPVLTLAGFLVDLNIHGTAPQTLAAVYAFAFITVDAQQREITVSVAGTIEGTAFEVSAVIDGITRSADHNIPEKVSLAASKLEADFAYGTVSLTVDGGRITGLSVRCTGTMQVVLVETEVSVSAAVAIQNVSALQFPDKAVSALTQTDG